MKDSKDVNVYTAKLKKYQIYEFFLVMLEIIGLVACTTYVFISTFGFVNYTTPMMGLIVFMISIIMALINSGNVRKKKNIIKDYLNAVKNDLPSEIKKRYKNKAEQLITPLDIYKEKIKKGENIRLHDKRVVIRSYIFGVGIILMVGVAIIVLFVADLNFPILIAWESLIAYFLVMLEFYIYQSIVNKSNSNVFSDIHKNIVSTKNIQRVEEMKYLQKILYMRCDRFKNYLLSLRVSTIVMNVFSISITIIVAGDSEKIMRWFGFTNASNIVSVIFAVSTITLYVIDLLFGNIIDEKINKMEAYILVPYSHENYDSLRSNFPNLLEYKGVFDRHALDIARGTYEYNLEKIDDNKKCTIYYKYLFTVKQRIINNIPRVKMTSLVTFLFMGSIFVWYKMNIYNIIYVCLTALIVFLISYNGMFIYEITKHKKWNLFCKALNDNDL